MEVVMTEKDLSKLGLLDEFSITELEQRLEFEAWCDWNCGCGPDSPPPPDDGGGGGTPPSDSMCTNENCPCADMN
jgi:hypothetical protein